MGEVMGGDFLLHGVRFLAKLMEGKKGDGAVIGQGTRMDVMGRMDKIGREANSAEWATCGLKVQLRDETGRTFAGFGAEDCKPIVEAP